MIRLGIVSDTHGQLRSRVLEQLDGCDRILHAGDVGDATILDRLGELAPTDAVRGNVDFGDRLSALPAVISGSAEQVAYRMIHQREHVPVDWQSSAQLIIYGHNHRPELEWRGRTLWLNPGAAGPRRFHLPLTVAVVTIHESQMVPEIFSVEPE